MFDRDVVEPAVDLLAELAGRRARAGAGHRDRAHRPAAGGSGESRCTASTCRARWSRRLRAKPGGDAIGVTIGDFATTTVDGTFSVAYLVFNTIMNLTTQAAQVACFRNVAAHLEPGGCFVIEVVIPDLRRLPPGRRSVPFHVSPTRWGVRRVRRRDPGDELELHRGRGRPRRVSRFRSATYGRPSST